LTFCVFIQKYSWTVFKIRLWLLFIYGRSGARFPVR
jgi:hypothetical protein